MRYARWTRRWQGTWHLAPYFNLDFYFSERIYTHLIPSRSPHRSPPSFLLLSFLFLTGERVQFVFASLFVMFYNALAQPLATFALALSLAGSAQAFAHGRSVHRAHVRDLGPRGKSYQLTDYHQGQSFFECAFFMFLSLSLHLLT